MEGTAEVGGVCVEASRSRWRAEETGPGPGLGADPSEEAELQITWAESAAWVKSAVGAELTKLRGGAAEGTVAGAVFGPGSGAGPCLSSVKA